MSCAHFDSIVPPGWRLLGLGRTAAVYDSGDGSVRKLFYDWFPEEAIASEHRIASSVSGLLPTIPTCLGRETVQGVKAIRYSLVPGISMGQAIVALPLGLRRHVSLFARSHVEILTVRCDALPSTAERLGWAIRNQTALPSEKRDELLELLRRTAGGGSLNHGDFHPLNLLIQEGKGQAIDWMNASSGPPEADVARTWLILRFARSPQAVSLWQGLIEDCYMRAFSALYLRAIFSTKAFKGKEIRKSFGCWQLLHAAGRLSDGPGPSETANLLKFIHKRSRD